MIDTAAPLLCKLYEIARVILDGSAKSLKSVAVTFIKAGLLPSWLKSSESL